MYPALFETAGKQNLAAFIGKTRKVTVFKNHPGVVLQGAAGQTCQQT